MEVTVEAKRKSRISIARPLGSSAHQRYAIMHERCQLRAAPPINRWINHGIKNTNLQYAELYGLVPRPSFSARGCAQVLSRVRQGAGENLHRPTRRRSTRR